MKSYNITLSESELLDVVTALAQIAGSGLRCGPAATEMHELSRRITDQAAEQFHDERQRHDLAAACDRYDQGKPVVCGLWCNEYDCRYEF